MTAEEFKELVSSCFAINAPNGVTLAVITLSNVHDLVAIVLGLTSTVCTILITWHKLKRRKDNE